MAIDLCFQAERHHREGGRWGCLQHNTHSCCGCAQKGRIQSSAGQWLAVPLSHMIKTVDWGFLTSLSNSSAHFAASGTVSDCSVFLTADCSLCSQLNGKWLLCLADCSRCSQLNGKWLLCLADCSFCSHWNSKWLFCSFWLLTPHSVISGTVKDCHSDCWLLILLSVEQ